MDKEMQERAIARAVLRTAVDEFAGMLFVGLDGKCGLTYTYVDKAAGYEVRIQIYEPGAEFPDGAREIAVEGLVLNIRRCVTCLKSAPQSPSREGWRDVNRLVNRYGRPPRLHPEDVAGWICPECWEKLMLLDGGNLPWGRLESAMFYKDETWLPANEFTSPLFVSIASLFDPPAPPKSDA